MARSQQHVDKFFGVLAGTVPFGEFFDPANLAEMVAPATT
jgi:hypothetical protein